MEDLGEHVTVTHSCLRRIDVNMQVLQVITPAWGAAIDVKRVLWIAWQKS